jgi:acetyl/propionyl-CoA carboxylase alpha subunit
MHLRANGGEHRVSARALGDGQYEVHVDDGVLEVVAGTGGASIWFVTPDGHRHEAWVARLPHGLQVRTGGRTWLLENVEHAHGGHETEIDPTRVTAPMTGTIVRILVAPGDAVAKDQDLIVLTAMKMEHRLAAAAAGTVAEITAREGDTVDAGALLVRLE